MNQNTGYSSTIPLSVILITLNEAANIKRLLKSLPENLEIVVVDSGSSDSTIEIAKGYGATVYQRDFDDYSGQKNFALQKASGEYILWVDADEQLSSELKQLVQQIASGSIYSQFDGFKIRRRLVFQDRVLRFGKTTDNPLRLFKKQKGRFVGAIHEKVDLGPGSQIGHLKAEILHFSYQSLEDYFHRFNRYTTLVAKNHFEKGHAIPSRWQRGLRPFFEFVNRYFIRLGCLDGYPGYIYALCSSLYAFIKYEKFEELNRSTQER